MPSIAIENLLHTGSPLEDNRAYRRCLGQFATGVVVVTTDVRDCRAGLTVNSFTSLSMNPPLVMWCISKGARSFSSFQEAERFGVNVLAADQIPLSQLFAGNSNDKFAECEWTLPAGGSPQLNGVSAFFECRTALLHDAGDHSIVIGNVERFMHFDRHPLLFARGQYDTLHQAARM